ncbi:unnamed protein product [Rotaria magnacalcarata]|uniref:Dynein heavy chain ATP-binding dynein motor region domain-containing protein n=3 Tax=Rotaria magnacalcarata TaxID=392030 RepID=A0A816UVJ2_9BILA|nr:unnamed protein product [Rotaria magnacalcarata]
MSSPKFEKLDPSLDSLGMCAVKRIDRVDIFKLGDYKVEYIKDFRFYMITKLPNPYYISKRFLKANLINFAAKEQDLESQLPCIVVY